MSDYGVAAARFMSGIVRRVALHWGYFPSSRCPWSRRAGHRIRAVAPLAGHPLTPLNIARTLLLLQSFQSVRTIVYIYIWTQCIDYWLHYHFSLSLSESSLLIPSQNHFILSCTTSLYFCIEWFNFVNIVITITYVLCSLLWNYDKSLFTSLAICYYYSQLLR